MSHEHTSPQSHPSPKRGATSLAALFFAVTAGPVGWTIQHLVGYGLASYPCNPDSRQLTAPLAGWAPLRPSLVVLSLACLILALAGGWVAYRSFRATRDETAGEAADPLEIGAGRSRWMAVCGIMVTVLFAGAIVFDGIVLLGSPSCRG